MKKTIIKGAIGMCLILSFNPVLAASQPPLEKKALNTQTTSDENKPLPIFGFKLNTYTSTVILKWFSSSNEPLSYIIEASRRETGPFYRIAKTKNKKIIFSTKSVKKYNWFRIVSVNTQGKKSAASVAKQKISASTGAQSQNNAVIEVVKEEDFIRPYQVMLKTDPDNVKIKMQIAILHSRFGRYDKAVKIFDEIAADDPKNISAIVNKGNIFLAQKKYANAIFIYLKAKWKRPNDPYIHLNLAFAFYGKGDYENASKSYKKAIKLDPLLRRPYRAFVKLLIK